MDLDSPKLTSANPSFLHLFNLAGAVQAREHRLAGWVELYAVRFHHSWVDNGWRTSWPGRDLIKSPMSQADQGLRFAHEM